ncbi:response regulator [Bradyrhizobium sp.]|uniref:response regulator n=1 Tax=Bradyrhizobium sp. TaxID=376 RepID=UPI003C4BBC2F
MHRILVVDNDPPVCEAIRAWLMHHGYRVSIADGGNDGLAALDNGTFELMIVDVVMPDMPGFESIRVLHRRAPTLPLIAISGSAFLDPESFGPDFLRLASRLGATRCLRKPFKPATLLAVIDQCLSEADPHRRYVAALGAVVDALVEPQGRPRLAGNMIGHALGR